MKRFSPRALIGLLLLSSLFYCPKVQAQEIKSKQREFIGKVLKISPAQVLVEKKRVKSVIVRNHFKIDASTMLTTPLQVGDTVKVTYRIRSRGKRSRKVRIATKIDIIDASRKGPVMEQPDTRRYSMPSYGVGGGVRQK
ncbi:MAG: hypothetical protein WC695_02670 [Candidatus Omnitrophota bacterium]